MWRVQLATALDRMGTQHDVSLGHQEHDKEENSDIPSTRPTPCSKNSISGYIPTCWIWANRGVSRPGTGPLGLNRRNA